ncbi:MAG: biotin/lipoyl-binding protein, partial [Bacteroidota bacterium]
MKNEITRKQEVTRQSIDDRLAEKQLYSLKILRTPGLSIYLARVLMVLSVIAVASLFMPWQQNIRGRGKVTALNPANRPQTVQSVIPGQIKNWYVVEGQYVTAGDTLLELGETKDKYFDPQILVRMGDQIDAKKSGLLAKEMKKEAYQNQIKFLDQSLTVKLQQTKNKIEQTKLKVDSDSLKLVAEQVNLENQTSIFERNKRRYDAGNITRTKFQEMETKYNEARAKLNTQRNALDQTRTDLAIAITDLTGVQAEYAEKISKATSDLQATLSEINEAVAEIAKLENEYSNVEVRREQYYLKAPQSGYVVQALKVGIGENIKEGEAIVTIQPNEPDLAVEMYVRAMDVPLIQRERKVRIE